MRVARNKFFNFFFYRLGQVLRNWLLITCSILCLTIRCSVERPRRVIIIVHSATGLIWSAGTGPFFPDFGVSVTGKLGKRETRTSLSPRTEAQHSQWRWQAPNYIQSMVFQAHAFPSFLLFAFLRKGRVCSQHSSCQGKWCVVDVNYVATANHKRYTSSPTFFTVADWLLTGNL